MIGFQIDEAEIDQTLWSLFGLSRMEMLQSQVYTEAINLGTSYVSIWPDPIPKLAWESGLTVTHEVEPGDPSTVAAALKVWKDTIRGQMRANLYLPDAIYKWATEVNPPDPNAAVHDTQWIENVLPGGISKWSGSAEVIDNPYGIVPMVPFIIRPNWDGYGRSDLDDLYPVFTRIENLTVNILLAVELGAFRQRWATGLDVPRGPGHQPSHRAVQGGARPAVGVGASRDQVRQL